MSKTTKTTKNKQKRGYKWPSRPEIFKSFAVWMAYPPKLRSPLNQGEFAVLNQVSPDTLSDYKKKEKFWELVKENKEKLKIEIQMNIDLDKMFKDMEERE